ncbi:spermidine synthase [Nucisporomicrobium flavum]|jgi:spermidine synthase|uniref:spermidine synthase n=1 Tax=Nucisporomicrobium flavum TaxID=2785915 RepID=UPI0018F4D345|nr:fused MFS/spermidine synthase [Nucisporomicrobium flavum]
MAPHGNRRATIFARVSSGTATLEPDPARGQGWTVCVDGVPQSYVDLGDPTVLAFEYVRRLATVLRLCAPAAVPLRVLHLGGGGLTLPRWVSATRPGSSQTVVERDPLLLAVVAKHLPWPASVGVEVADAREFVEAGDPQSYDVVVTDVFEGAAMPASVAGVGFARAAARLLRPGGVLAMNLTDVPPLAYSRIQAATLRAAFGEVAMIAPPGLLRGRKAGNVVLAAAAVPGGLPVAGLAAAVARDAEPARVWHGDELTVFLGGAKARLDGYA